MNIITTRALFSKGLIRDFLGLDLLILLEGFTSTVFIAFYR